MSPSEIWNRARILAPNILLRDVWHLLKELRSHGLVMRLTHSGTKSRIHAMTDLGRAVVKQAFGIRVQPLTKGVDWEKYSIISSGPLKRLLLLEIGSSWLVGPQEKTAREIRRRLQSRRPVGEVSMRRALRQLKALGLVSATPLENGTKRNIYVRTAAGTLIADELLR